MLNYVVDPAILRPFVPAGTELDFFQDRTYVSLVGFRFLNTRILGVPIPFHRNFDELNLRFYVRRQSADGWRRGVVFIREFVPRLAIALIARAVYNENYSAIPMTHQWSEAPDGNPQCTAAYGWRWRGVPHQMSIQVRGNPGEMVPGSEAEFIAEHYWGYTTQRNGSTQGYRVEHPPWRVWPMGEARLSGPLTECYGADFARCLQGPPASSFLAEGSAVKVYGGVRID